MPNYNYSLHGRDGYKRGFKRSGIVTGDTFDDALTNLQVFMSRLEFIMAGSLTKAVISETIPGVNLPEADSNRDEGVSVQFDLGSGKTATWNVPAPEKAFVAADGTVDLTQTRYADFVSMFTDGWILISDGEQAVAGLKATLDK